MAPIALIFDPVDEFAVRRKPGCHHRPGQGTRHARRQAPLQQRVVSPASSPDIWAGQSARRIVRPGGRTILHAIRLRAPARKEKTTGSSLEVNVPWVRLLWSEPGSGLLLDGRAVSVLVRGRRPLPVTFLPARPPRPRPPRTLTRTPSRLTRKIGRPQRSCRTQNGIAAVPAVTPGLFRYQPMIT